MILAFAHPGIVVSDLDKAIAFYRDMFGFRLISRSEGWQDNPVADRGVGVPDSACTGAMLAGHNCYLEMFVYSAPKQTATAPRELLAHEQGIRHLAFYVDDVHKEYERLISLGGSRLGEPMEVREGVYAVYARDPFGNIIELAEIPSPQENPTELPGVKQLSDYGGS
jgi:catechol 2,3-dioxygenase-like lactoylglutathione lyase family enzyme